MGKIYSNAFSNLGEKYTTEYFRKLQDLIRINHGLSLILVADPQCPIDSITDLGECLGYAAVYENQKSDTGDSYVHITEVCINPTYQGFGFSHTLLDQLLNLSSNTYQNSEWIDLNVAEENDIAHNLYKKHGFKDMFRTKMGGMRMAKPLHDNYAFHIYPCFNPSVDKNPGKPDYYTESAAYPVLRFAPYTKKLYGEMIRFNYPIYEDDPTLSKKEVNARAKQDASALLGAIDKDPKNFKVYCAVTDVSIAGYVIMMKDANGYWTLIMDHYYDTDRKDLQKLVDYAVKECGIDKDPTAVFETMISRDELRGKCKTKYRSMYTFEDYKDTVLTAPEINDKGELVVPEKEKYTTIQTPLPNSKPQEPTLKGTEFKQKDVVKPADVSPAVSEPAQAPSKPKYSTVPTQVPSSTPVEPASKTKIFVPPKPVVVPTKPDVVPPEPKVPKTTNIPDKVEEPLDIQNAPNVKSSLGNYKAPEAMDADENIPNELRDLANDVSDEAEKNAEDLPTQQKRQPRQRGTTNRLPSMSTAAPTQQQEPEQRPMTDDELVQIADQLEQEALEDEQNNENE